MQAGRSWYVAMCLLNTKTDKNWLWSTDFSMVVDKSGSCWSKSETNITHVRLCWTWNIHVICKIWDCPRHSSTGGAYNLCCLLFFSYIVYETNMYLHVCPRAERFFTLVHIIPPQHLHTHKPKGYGSDLEVFSEVDGSQCSSQSVQV